MEGGGFEPPKLTRQIYSLIPLATREPLQKGAHFLDVHPWCQPLPRLILHPVGKSSKNFAATVKIYVRSLINILIGAGERNRTPDRLITNQLLYLLSYASQIIDT